MVAVHRDGRRLRGLSVLRRVDEIEPFEGRPEGPRQPVGRALGAERFVNHERGQVRHRCALRCVSQLGDQAKTPASFGACEIDPFQDQRQLGSIQLHARLLAGHDFSEAKTTA